MDAIEWVYALALAPLAGLLSFMLCSVPGTQWPAVCVLLAACPPGLAGPYLSAGIMAGAIPGGLLAARVGGHCDDGTDGLSTSADDRAVQDDLAVAVSAVVLVALLCLVWGSQTPRLVVSVRGHAPGLLALLLAWAALGPQDPPFCLDGPLVRSGEHARRWWRVVGAALVCAALGCACGGFRSSRRCC